MHRLALFSCPLILVLLLGLPTHSPGQDDHDRIRNPLKRALPGRLEAQYKLGVAYWLGEGVSMDKEYAVTWVRSAAEGGFALAQHDLGMACSLGEGEGKNIRKQLSGSAGPGR